ncbi:MAG: polyamine aminopropyltransferase, partial [Rhabdochlamydiaceae bacterium]
QREEFIEIYKNRSPHFKDAGFYLVAVPTYVGGFLAIGYATERTDYRSISEEEIAKRVSKIGGSFKYYNPEIHKASFALPQFIHDMLKQ